MELYFIYCNFWLHKLSPLQILHVFTTERLGQSQRAQGCLLNTVTVQFSPLLFTANGTDVKSGKDRKWLECVEKKGKRYWIRNTEIIPL